MSTLMKKSTFSTELNADSTEWCPIEEYADLFICGTYQLTNTKNENTSDISERRLGCLYLFRFSALFPGYLKVLQQISMPGILDCKWCHVKLHNKVYLALVNAVGELRMLELESQNEVILKEIQKIKLTSDEKTLLLSLDWSTGISSSVVKIVVSHSIGEVTILSFHDGCLHKDKTWNAHSFEAWIVAFNYWNVNMFFSGGDDCKLNCFDIRIGKIVNSNKSHGAGVTSMHVNFKKEHSLISGSYDEHIMFWDVRSLKTPLHKINVGGGVWRLKWEPKLCNKICASCMYFGSVVIDAVNIKVINEYKEHTSINYGIDWSSLNEEQILNNFKMEEKDNYRHHLISVCSFYDNLLSLGLLSSPICD